ncbi:UTP-glucose-1-phosphate uridylyltransferase [Mycena galopus ATCC 62051]|nr:UTP-glucose-1-phosphate uridylyltransferase [Mycena galopus ATCC 62051]
MPLFKYRRLHYTRRKHVKTLPSTGLATSMRDELTRLVGTVPENANKKGFDTEMQTFLSLFTRYLAEKVSNEEIDWNKIKSPAENQIVAYDNLTTSIDPKSLQKLAVLKVNGGLGTSMGMTGAKSALEVKNGMTFLDLTVKQIEHLNTMHDVDVPLILMTSFNTHEDNALLQSGVLDQLLAEGKEYLFVSNSDNLGAVVDQRILEHMIYSGTEFLMEVTDKTKADIKGGTLIDYNGSIRLLEIAQVPSEHLDEFKSVRKFKIFNTNNLWINLKALKRVMDKGGIDLDIIVNPKVTEKGEAVIQLETAAGAAIKHFKNAHGINVPRSRFLPVKSCSDLLLIKSDVYAIENGQLVVNPERMFSTTPVIQLGDHFKKIQQFQKRFKNIPRIIDLDHLTVTGDVYFGRDVTLRGTVVVIANESQTMNLPDGCIIENRLLLGNLNMIEL